jgi:thiol-disulfide isomerase/thioredoxin
MIKIKALALPTLMLALGLPAMAGPVQEILEKAELEKATALEAYLGANAEAADADEARSALVEAYLFLGQADKLQPLLMARYEGFDKSEAGDLGELMMEVVQPLFMSLAESGDKDGARGFLDKVSEDMAAHPAAAQIGQFFGQLASELDKPGVGDVMEIAFTATDGREIDLAAMEGKVVLVDFWATWCGPCIAEMPNLLAAYEKFHDKGFEILGISLDQDGDALAEYVKENGLKWPQYFDGKGWENEFSTQFGITSIPATYLIGKEGKVVAMDLRGAALEAAIAKELE